MSWRAVWDFVNPWQANRKITAKLIADGDMTLQEYEELQLMCRAGMPGLPPSLEARLRAKSEES